MWRNTEKHTKAPENWSFAGPKHHGLACSTKAFFEHVRCQNVALEYTINQLRFHTNMWRNTQKSSWKSTLRKQNVAEHGRILIKKLHFYTKMWQNTQKHLKIDPSQRPNTMAWRVQPRRFLSTFSWHPMSKRCAWIHHKSATLSHGTCGETHTKAAENRPCAGEMWRNTEESSSRSYIFTRKCGETHKSTTKLWQNTQKHLKIDPSQGPNTMAWRVQPRRFSSMSDVKPSRLNPL